MILLFNSININAFIFINWGGFILNITILLKHFLNRHINESSEKIFEGICNGRKKALENWFQDKWVQIDNIQKSLNALKDDDEFVNQFLNEIVVKYEDFCEIFIIDEAGNVTVSSCRQHIGMNMSDLPNLQAGIEGKSLMYGPYEDKNTLDTDIQNKKFYDEVTLMFSTPCKNENGEKRILCCRALNDDMSNVIQDEDSHIYKNSGDNYLFMVKSNRGIKQGTAISRSRFEDNTFTLGDNLKDGVRTINGNIVKIENHTEFEITFTDPLTNELHQGILNTIKNGSNLDCWPGYPDYRHILVGGKGTIIKPPNCDEVWGMMCEGDISEIYDFKSINFKMPIAISALSAVLFIADLFINKNLPQLNTMFLIFSWVLISIFSVYSCSQNIVKPLSKTINILHDIAEGEGNLTKRVNKNSSDEIGELSRWFNKFINSQMTLLKRVLKSSKTTKKSVNIVSGISNDVKDGMVQIQDTVINLLENAKYQNSTFQKTRDKFSNISASIQEMDSLILEISSVVQDTNDNAQNAQQKSNTVTINMEHLEDIIKKTVESINKLQNNSDKITEIIQVISDISQQTQLLALNASIEAAKAGESGRGFSVVAEEISQLAQETQEATKSISSVIKNVEFNTTETYEFAKQINAKVDESIYSVKDSIESFEKLNEDIKLIADAMNSISCVTATQSKDVSEVMDNVSNMADKINESTELNSNKSEQSLITVKNILKSTQKLKQATEALEYISDNMDDMVGAFKLS